MRKRKAANTPKRKEVMSTRKIALMSLFSAFATILLVVLYGWWTWGGGWTWPERLRMESYLNNKYGQVFSVNNIQKKSTIGDSGIIAGDAYQVSDPDAKFRIWRNADSRSGKYTDLFLSALWSKQAYTASSTFIKNNLSNVDSYLIDVRPYIDINATTSSDVGTRYPVQGRVLNLDEALSKYPEKVSYSITVRSTIPLDAAQPNEVQLDQALKVVNFVKQLKLQHVTIHYLYRDVSYRETDDVGAPRYQFSISVADEIDSINTTRDLKSQFRRLHDDKNLNGSIGG